MKKKLSPTQAVKAHCQECLGLKQHNREEIENCKGDTCVTGACPLFPYRLGKRISVKVFRAFCKQCMGGNDSFIKDCASTNCRIYPYRFGKNPARQGKGRNFPQKGREPANFKRQSTVTGQGASV